MTDITLAKLQTMTDEEVHELNRKLARKIAIHMAVFVGVKIGITVACFVISKKLGDYVVENTPKED